MSDTIRLIQGDITKLEVDAVVNAANSSLLGGGGVDGAIHRAGGGAILEECRLIRSRQGGCDTGEAVVTTGGKLPARKVIHTVGPVWTGQNVDSTDQLLASCYVNSMKLAIEHGLRSIAFPNISTGVYGYPKRRAAKIVIDAVQNFPDLDKEFDSIWFVCFDQENLKIYQELLEP